MRDILLILLALTSASVGCQPPQRQLDVSPSAQPQTDERRSAGPHDPLGTALESIAAEDITSLSISLFEYDHGSNPETQETKIDITSEREHVLPLLKNSRLVNSGFMGVGMWPIGSLELTAKNGLALEFALYPFGFFLTESTSDSEYPTMYVYDTELKHFWNALKYDNANRIYSEESYRDLLFRYASRPDDKLDAFMEFAESFDDPRIVALIPSYLNKTGRVLFSLRRLKNIDDPRAIDAVCRHLYSRDINTSRIAADVLDSWGQLAELNRRTFFPSPDDLKDMEGGSANFCTHMAHWYAEHGRYSDAVKTVRAHGIDQFDLTRDYCLLRPLHPHDEASVGKPDPKPTEVERLEIILLMADIVEQRGLSVLGLRDLWDAMGVQYDIDADKLVPRDEESELFFGDVPTRKKAANAMRKWLQEKPKD